MKILIGWVLILSSLAIIFTQYYFPLYEFVANIAGIILILSIFFTAMEMGLKGVEEDNQK